MSPPHANIRVEMRLSRVTTNRSADYMQLRITDSASGQGILDLNLTAEEFLDLMTGHQPGSVQGVAARFPSPEVRQRIGKTTAVASLNWKSSGAPEEDSLRVRHWLEQVRQMIGAHAVSKPTRHNTGNTTARFRIYVGDAREAEAWQGNAQDLLNEMTPPWEEQ